MTTAAAASDHEAQRSVRLTDGRLGIHRTSFRAWHTWCRQAARAARGTIKECHTIDGQTQSDIRRRALLVGVSFMGAVFALDQFSKWLVLRELGPDGARDSVTLIPGFLQLIFVRNTGAAFGIFQGGSGLLTILALVAIVLLLVYFVRSATEDWVLTLALGLMLGGAIGNIVDRFQHGYVIDWIDVPRWPTFNIADSAITIGVALLVYAMLFRDQQRHTAGGHAAEPRAPVQEDA